MAEDERRFEPESFEELLEKLVCSERDPRNSIEFKLDVLERVLEYIRFGRRYLENELELEEFLKGDVFIDQ